MQEQLKAHQLEELLRLQEEQQRLLGMMNGSEHCAGGSDDESVDESDCNSDHLFYLRYKKEIQVDERGECFFFSSPHLSIASLCLYFCPITM